MILIFFLFSFYCLEKENREFPWRLIFKYKLSLYTAHKGFTITPNVNYKCPRSVAAIALPVAAMALPQPPIYLKPT